MDIQATLRTYRDPLILATLALIVLGTCWFLPDVVLPFLVSYVLAYVFLPVIRLLEKPFERFTRRRSELRSYAVTSFFLVGTVLTLVILIPMLLGLVAQLQGLGDLVTHDGTGKYRERIIEILEDIKLRARNIPYLEQMDHILTQNQDKMIGLVTQAFKQVGNSMTGLLNAGVGALFAGLGQIANYALVPLLLFYMLLDWERLTKVFYLLIPEPYLPWSKGFLKKVDRTLRDFIRGQFLICVIFGTLMTVGLLICRIPYAFVIGPISGVANLVPYLGVVVGVTPAVLLSVLAFGWNVRTVWALVGIAIVYVVINTIDGFVLQPRITARLVRLHPIVVIMALVLGGNLLGFYGLFLAVPVVAVLRVLFEDVYERLYGRAWPFA